MFFPKVPPRPEQTAQSGTFPAPTKGINSVMSLASMEPTDAILTVNIDATTYGLRVRPGYSEYAVGFSGDEAKTIIPFTGSAESGVNDRLFVATNDGIFDISESTEAPTKVVDFPIKSTDSGWCIFVQVVNDNGDHVLLVTDSANGFYRYLESTGLWSKPIVTGPTGNLVFCTVWKQRVWFIEENSTSAWYTDVGTFSGVVTEFNFGNKFRYGGNLVALYSWTLDAGEGADDYLVSVSSAGDVVVYSGTDPSSPNTFGQIGRWFIGALPAGRRVGSQFGGDLLLLSVYGLISMQDLLKGSNPFTSEASLSWKIQGFISDLMRETREVLGWEVKLHPSLSRIIVSAPKLVNQPFRQFVFDVQLEAWSIWEDVPILTSESYKGDVYIASPSAQVWTLTGSLDNVHITPQEQVGTYLITYTMGVNSPEFTLGDTITGATSGATGVIMSTTPLYLGISGVTGTFIEGEIITGSAFPNPVLVVTSDAVQSLATMQSVVTSLDNGVTWTARACPATTTSVGAAFSTTRGEILMLSATGQITRSTDGINFANLANNIGNGAWVAITRSDSVGLYVAIGNDSGDGNHRVATSPDGVTWTRRSITFRSYANVQWIEAVGLFFASTSGTVTQPGSTSPDGINWTQFTSWGFSTSNYGVARSDSGRYMFCTRDNNFTISSTNLSVFGQVSGILANTSVAYNSDMNIFVCMSADGVYSAPGVAGTPWSNRASSSAYIDADDVTSVSFGGFVALRSLSGAVTTHRILRSEDGIVWSESAPAAFDVNSNYSKIIEAILTSVPTATLNTIALNPTDKLPIPIAWRGLTAYSDLGLPEKWKAVGFIRPVFISELVPSFGAQAKYDYDLEELTSVLVNSPYGGGTWDQSDWDLAVWGGSPLSRLLPPRGGAGMGRMVALSWAGESQAETILVSFGLIFNPGGHGI